MTAPDCPFPPLLPTWPVFAGYTALRPLGSGGMGRVFVATHSGIPGEVALKILDPAQLGAGRGRLLAEARAAVAVEHQGLVRCLDLGEVAGHPYLALELMPGGDGDAMLRRHRGRIPSARLVRIAREALAGLAALHAAGVLHRDLKPANLLFDADERARLADFGLALLDDGSPGVTRAGFTVGTPDYMAPEQARAEELDGRADLYALGATLYHLATGRPPHAGATAWAVLGAVLSEPFPDPLVARSDLDPHLAAVISKLGAKKVDERYQDAAAALSDLALVAAARAPVHAQHRSSEAVLRAEAPGSRPLILLVDDDPLIRRLYEAGLGRAGFAVVGARDGSDGLVAARQRAPAAAVVDLGLPDLAGAKVVRLLRGDAVQRPIVVLTNAFAADELAEAQAAGADLVLTKAEMTPAALARHLARLLATAPLPVAPQDPAAGLAAADAAAARLHVLGRRLGPAADQQPVLGEVVAAARGLSAAAAVAGRPRAATLAAALEALARELAAQPARRTDSTTRTVVQAAQALHRLLLASAPASAAPRALAVDDDRMARTLLGASLGRAGIAHEVVATPAEALERLRRGGIDLLVTDVMMDGMTGFQLAAEVRRLPGGEAMPILFVTGLDGFSTFFAGGGTPGVDLIAKPYLLIELGVKALVLLAPR